MRGGDRKPSGVGAAWLEAEKSRLFDDVAMHLALILNKTT
jgi:hypothetical protein